MQVSLNRGRRRRVVLDEAMQSDLSEQEPARPIPSNAPTPEDPSPSYSEGARRRFQLRTTDLIPKRMFTLVAVISVLLSAVLGIILLDSFAAGWIEVIGQRGVDMFTIGLPSSLSTWFSALILILTAIACLQIYVLRQHRRDDYRGVYRWWLWMALILLFASLNNVVGIVEVAMTAVGHLFKADSGFTAGWGWVLVKFGVLALLIGRFGFEMRISRGAMVGCAIIFATYCGALVVESNVAAAEFAGRYQMTFGNFLLFGQVAVFTVVLVFSRYIYLEAHGLVKVRVKKEKKEKVAKPKRVRKSKKKSAATEKDESEEKAPAKEKVAARKSKRQAEPAKEPPKKERQSSRILSTPLGSRKAKPQANEPAKSKSKKVSSSEQEDSGVGDEIQSLEGKTLSKSERRRLKKLQRRQNRAA